MSENWYEDEAFSGFDDDTRAFASKYENPAAAIAGGFAAEKRLGHPADSLIVKPAVDAEQDAHIDVLRKLGAPETFDDWKIPEIEGVPEGAISEVAVTSFREFGPTIGLQGWQMDALAKWQIETGLASSKAAADALEASKLESKAAIEKEFGQAYEPRMALKDQVLEKYGGGARDVLKAAGLDDHPEIMGMLGRIGAEFESGSMLDGEKDRNKGLQPGAQTPAEIDQEVSTIETQMQKIGPRHQDYGRLSARRLELLKQKQPA